MQENTVRQEKGAWAGKSSGAIAFALIFWFFCIKAKEQGVNT
jgi:hypothetical protein